MIATGIILMNREPVRYVHGDTATFTLHVEPGETLLITQEDIFVDGQPDPARAQRVIDSSFIEPMRTIAW